MEWKEGIAFQGQVCLTYTNLNFCGKIFLFIHIFLGLSPVPQTRTPKTSTTLKRRTRMKNFAHPHLGVILPRFSSNTNHLVLRVQEQAKTTRIQVSLTCRSTPLAWRKTSPKKLRQSKQHILKKVHVMMVNKHVHLHPINLKKKMGQFSTSLLVERPTPPRKRPTRSLPPRVREGGAPPRLTMTAPSTLF